VGRPPGVGCIRCHHHVQRFRRLRHEKLPSEALHPNLMWRSLPPHGFPSMIGVLIPDAAMTSPSPIPGIPRISDIAGTSGISGVLNILDVVANSSDDS